MPYVRERSTSEGEDGGPNVDVRDDLDAKYVCEAGTTIASEGAENEVFTFLVEDEDAGEHFGGERAKARRGR